MSNQETQAKSPLADSWSRTRGKVVNFSHVWTIENFSFYQKDTVIVSPPFSAGENDETQWCLKLYPNGENEEIQDHISLQLCLLSCKTDGVPASFKLSILNADQEPVRKMVSGSPELFEPGKGRGPEYFIRRESVLTNHFNCLPGDKFTVFCELSALMETFIISGWSSTEQSGKVPDQLDESQPLSQIVMPEIGTFEQRESDVLNSRILGLNNCPRENFLRQEDSPEDEERRLRLHEAEAYIRDTEKYITQLELQYAVQKSLLEDMIEQRNNTAYTQSTIFNEPQRLDPSVNPIDLRQNWRKTPTKRAIESRELPLLYQLKALRDTVDEVRTTDSEAEKSDRWKTKEQLVTKKSSKQSHPMNLCKTRLSRMNGNRSDDHSASPSSAEERESIDVPVLDLEIFNGDGASFYGWWLEFKRQVHDRRDLCMDQKLNCLRSLLEGDATRAIEGTPFEEADYLLTLRNLFLIYGRDRPLPVDLIPIFREMIEDSFC